MELTDIYLRMMFDMVAQAPFEHLHWGLWDGVPEQPDNFTAAQCAYADHLVRLIPEEVRRVADVGCGLGGIARQIAATDREVIAITPRADHAAAIGGHGFEVRHGRFEALKPEPVDLLLFAESLAFFDADEMLRCAADWLPEGGFLLAADLITNATADTVRAAGTVLHDEDVTELTRYTVEVLQHRFDRYVRPYHRGLMDTLEALDPELGATVERTLGNVPNRALRSLFAGRPAEEDLLAERRYRVLLIAHAQ